MRSSTSSRSTSRPTSASGSSFKAPLVGPAAFLELRYSQDVTGFADDVTPGITTDNTYKLSLVQLRLGVGL